MNKAGLFKPIGEQEDEYDYILRTQIEQYQERLDTNNQVVQALFWDDDLLIDKDGVNIFMVELLLKMFEDPHTIITKHR